MAVSHHALRRFSWVSDPDDALDMAYDWEHGDDDDDQPVDLEWEWYRRHDGWVD